MSEYLMTDIKNEFIAQPCSQRLFSRELLINKKKEFN